MMKMSHTGTIVFYMQILLLMRHVCTRLPDTYRSSLCYDIHGRANVNLRCPAGYTIRTLTSFTGISRYKACSYRAWDCVVQEGTMERCDNQSTCTVSVSYSDTQKTALSCGNNDQTKYFQIEYECRAAGGSNGLKSSTMATTTHSKFGLPGITPNESQDKDNGKLQSGLGSRLTLVAIVCGSAVAIIFVIAVMATLAHRLKKRSFDNASLYGPLGVGVVGSASSRGSSSPSRGSNQYSFATSHTSCLSNDSHHDNHHYDSHHHHHHQPQSQQQQQQQQHNSDRFSHHGNHFLENQQRVYSASSYEVAPGSSSRYPTNEL